MSETTKSSFRMLKSGIYPFFFAKFDHYKSVYENYPFLYGYDYCQKFAFAPLPPPPLVPAFHSFVHVSRLARAFVHFIFAAEKVKTAGRICCVAKAHRSRLWSLSYQLYISIKKKSFSYHCCQFRR